MSGNHKAIAKARSAHFEEYVRARKCRLCRRWMRHPEIERVICNGRNKYECISCREKAGQ